MFLRFEGYAHNSGCKITAYFSKYQTFTRIFVKKKGEDPPHLKPPTIQRAAETHPGPPYKGREPKMPRESLGPKGNKPRIPLVEQNTTRWYAQYRSVVRTLPLGGTHATIWWYARYHLVVRTIPFGGMHAIVR